MKNIKEASLADWLSQGSFDCPCGKNHTPGTENVIIESGAIQKLPVLLEKAGIKRPFVLSGRQTFAAAGDKVCTALEAAGISYRKFVFNRERVLPTEDAVGSAVMHFDHSCDGVVAIGSGVINDIGKILAKTTGRT